MAGVPSDASAEAVVRLVSALRGEGAHLRFGDAVADFPVSLMNAAPDKVPYTFWHQLEHIRICQHDILSYVSDPAYVSPEWPRGYWPPAGNEADEAAWADTIKRYYADLEVLVELVEQSMTRILDPVAHNAGRSIFGSVLIVVDHTSYHLGEFVMGRQILGAWKSELA